MGTIGTILIVLLNIAISWWNAWACGKAYPESKAVGGWTLAVVWSGLVMSACGFTGAYMLVLGYVAISMHWLNQSYLNMFAELTYLLIIIPVLGSSFVITAHSWLTFKREKNFMNFGVSAYNTFATISNTINAIRFVPQALSDVGSKLMSDDDDEDAKGKMAEIAIGLALLSILLGVLTTRMIFYKAAGSRADSIMHKINLEKKAYS